MKSPLDIILPHFLMDDLEFISKMSTLKFRWNCTILDRLLIS